MKNQISISLEFYFKGKKFKPSMVIDLDAHIQANRDNNSFYPLLANSNNIDLYSYEYEIMLTEDLIFSGATGLAEAFLEHDKFDFIAFERALRDEKLTKLVSKIASKYLEVDDLSIHPKLKAALLEAYDLGQKSN